MQRALPNFLFFQLLMDLRNHESAQRGITFFSLLRVLKLLLKQRLPICHSFGVFKFLFGKQLHFLKQSAIFLRSFWPFAFVTMIDIRLSWTIEWSSFGIFAIAFTTRNSDTAIRTVRWKFACECLHRCQVSSFWHSSLVLLRFVYIFSSLSPNSLIAS